MNNFRKLAKEADELNEEVFAAAFLLAADAVSAANELLDELNRERQKRSVIVLAKKLEEVLARIEKLGVKNET